MEPMSSSDTTYVVSYPYYAYYYCPAIIPVILRYHLVDFLKCKKYILGDLLSHSNFYEKSLSLTLYILKIVTPSRLDQICLVQSHF